MEGIYHNLEPTDGEEYCLEYQLYSEADLLIGEGARGDDG